MPWASGPVIPVWIQASPDSFFDLDAFRTLDATCRWSVSFHRLIEDDEIVPEFIPALQLLRAAPFGGSPTQIYDPKNITRSAYVDQSTDELDK